MAATGERSSWEASETSRRWRAWACSSRPSMRFMVRARRPISSSAGGACTRRCRAAAEIASTSARIASTGARARPATTQVIAATNASSSGSPTASSPPTAVVVSETASVDRATSTVRRPSGVSAPTATARNWPSASTGAASGTVTLADWPGRSRASGARPWAPGLAATTRPPESRTWISNSSGSSTATGPGPAGSTASSSATSWPRSRAAVRSSPVRLARSTATRARAPAAMASPATTAAATVVRTRTVPSRARPRGRSAAIGHQPVAAAADRLDGGPPERPVELVAQVAHVDLDDVGVALELVVPDVLDDLPLGHGLAPAAEQELQQGELAGGQLDLGLAPPGPLGRRVQAQVAGLEHGRPLSGAAPQQGPQPGHQHRVRERLGQVVVGAAVEGLDLVQLALLGGQHQDRGPDAVAAQGRAQPVAVDPGQHDVQDDHVVGVLAGHPQPVGAVQGHVDREPLGGQPVAEPGGQPPLVLHHQHPHPRSFLAPETILAPRT